MLERQRERMKWQQEQHHQQNQSYFCGSGFDGAFTSLQVPNSQGLMMMMMNGAGDGSGLGDVVANARSVKPDPGSESGWPELGKFELPNLAFVSSGFNANSAISRTSSCPPSVAAAMATPLADAKGKESVSSATEKMRSASGRESFKKRKSEKIQNPKVCVVFRKLKLKSTLIQIVIFCFSGLIQLWINYKDEIENWVVCVFR